MHSERIFLLHLFSLLLVGILGCAGDPGEQRQLIQVSGIVSLDGSPVEGVTVWFVPRTGTPGNGGTGTTDATGKYTLQEANGQTGVMPGQYDVMFSKFAMPDGTPVAADVQPESVNAKQFMPRKYLKAETSGISADVSAASSSLDFALKSK
ncbi:MAG: hypothetical protein KDA76_01790 [Planctomycetaceae bacterium]|nr:hypothetical protein [Planctomycetaceae bacterium]